MHVCVCHSMLPSFFVVASPVLTATLNTLCSLRVLQRLTLTSCNGSTLAWRLPFATSEAAVCFSMLFFARVSPFSSCLLRTCLPLILVSSSHVSPPFPRALILPPPSVFTFLLFLLLLLLLLLLVLLLSVSLSLSPPSSPPPPPPPPRPISSVLLHPNDCQESLVHAGTPPGAGNSRATAPQTFWCVTPRSLMSGVACVFTGSPSTTNPHSLS